MEETILAVVQADSIPLSEYRRVYREAYGMSPAQWNDRCKSWDDYVIYCLLWRNLVYRFSDNMIGYESDYVKSIAAAIMAEGDKVQL